MGLYDTVKDVVSLAQKIDNVELMRDVVRQQAEANELAEENGALKQRLATGDKVAFSRNAYWIGQDARDPGMRTPSS